MSERLCSCPASFAHMIPRTLKNILEASQGDGILWCDRAEKARSEPRMQVKDSARLLTFCGAAITSHSTH